MLVHSVAVCCHVQRTNLQPCCGRCGGWYDSQMNHGESVVYYGDVHKVQEIVFILNLVDAIRGG